MTFVKVLFVLVLMVPFVIFVMYLIEKMIDDMKRSVRNSQINDEYARKNRRHHNESSVYMSDRERVRRRYAENKNINYDNREVFTGNPAKTNSKVKVKSQSKRKRRKARKLKRVEQKDREHQR